MKTKLINLLMMLILVMAIHQPPHTIYHPGNCSMIFFPLASNCVSKSGSGIAEIKLPA